MNLAIADPDIGRFRLNIFQQRSELGIVARNIKTEIPDAASLGLPPVISDLIMGKRGIIPFVGGTGSGKSTSLAALIDHRNKNSDGHIITIEDPVEFVHPHQGCIVNQREVGVDTNSYEEALKNADSKNNLRLKIQLAEGKTGEEEDDLDDEDGLGGLSLVSKDDGDPMSL